MALERSPFLKLDRQMVIGELKSVGSRDPDVLHNARGKIQVVAAFPKNAGTYVMVMGTLMTITILGAFIGIPLLALGWWMRKRGKQNLEEVEAGWSAFMNAAPARVVGAVSAA